MTRHERRRGLAAVHALGLALIAAVLEYERQAVLKRDNAAAMRLTRVGVAKHVARNIVRWQAKRLERLAKAGFMVRS